jgi:hypothetical protein
MESIWLQRASVFRGIAWRGLKVHLEFDALVDIVAAGSDSSTVATINNVTFQNGKLKAEYQKNPKMIDELAGYKVDVSHQELSRIIKELEDFYETCPADVWIPIEAAANWLCLHLGYDDYNELEDALHCTLEEFLTQLPHFDVKRPPADKPDDFVRFKSNLRDSAPGRPCKVSYRIENRGDLWAVMLKPKECWVEIPEMEFEIGRGDSRQVDTIYNLIGEAIYNLGAYLKTNHGVISEERFDGIYATIHQLNRLLDVEEPFTWIAHDPSGTVAFKPHCDRIKVEFTDLDTIHE